MKSLMIAALCLLNATYACADEEYELTRVICSKTIPAFQIERHTYWNIRHVIWPKRGDWENHVDALRKLEATESLYVFAELYGHYSGSTLQWNCGDIKAVATFDKLEREHPLGDPHPRVFVRSYPRLSVWFRGRSLISELPIHPYSMRVYADRDGDPYIAVCNLSHECKDRLAKNWGQITRKAVDAILSEPDL